MSNGRLSDLLEKQVVSSGCPGRPAATAQERLNLLYWLVSSAAFSFLLVGLVLLVGLSGCGNSHSPVRTRLYYTFQDGGIYRVDATYQLKSRMQKTYQGQTFVDQKHGLFVRATYQLRTQRIGDQADQWQIKYWLLRLSLHDLEGKFKLEIGPPGGRLSWYGEEQTLPAYLGNDGWKQYTQLIAQPLAQMQINGLGIPMPQPPAHDSNLLFNVKLLQLLGQNRILGEWILKGIKVPPVLMMVLPSQPIRIGEPWSYAAGQADPSEMTEWNKPLAANFVCQSLSNSRAALVYQSRTEFKGQELQSLRDRLGLKELDQVQFGLGYLTIKGQVQFLLAAGRPDSGRMEIEKLYRLTVQAEAWEFHSQEQHTFTLQVDQ